MDRRKKEFKHAKLYWQALKDEAAAYDELEMAITRIRLRFPGEQVMESVNLISLL